MTIASVWPELQVLMCSIASSRPATIFTAMIGARYSSRQSAAVASTSFAPAMPASRRRASDSAQQRISTPLAASVRAISGR